MKQFIYRSNYAAPSPCCLSVKKYLPAPLEQSENAFRAVVGQ